MLTRRYDALGHIVEVRSNSKRWLESLNRWWCMPPLPVQGGPGSRIRITLHEVDLSEFDSLLPIPKNLEPRASGTLQVDPELIPYTVYVQRLGIFHDYAGYGRCWVSSGASGTATVVLNRSTGLHPAYADILFGFNLLNRLLQVVSLHAIHASCVDVGGLGVLLTGGSGRGKSTAGYALMRKGHRILSDERVLVQRAGNGFSAGTLSDVIKLREKALTRFFPELKGEQPLEQLAEECYFKAGSNTILPFTDKTRVACILTLEQTGMPETTIETTRASHLAGEMFPVSMGGFDPGTHEEFV